MVPMNSQAGRHYNSSKLLETKGYEVFRVDIFVFSSLFLRLHDWKLGS